MASLAKQVFSGVVITAITKYSGIIIGLFISAILARILTPEEFGIVAIVTVFITFFNFLGEFGIGPAIIQNKSLNHRDISAIFSFTFLIAIVLSCIFFLSAPYIASFYESEVLVFITRVLSLAIFFNILKMVPQSLILKDLNFRLVGVITIVIQIIAGIFAIVLAKLDFSYLSLVYRSVLTSILLFIGCYLVKPIRPTRPSKVSIKKILSFSTYQFLFNLINYFSRNSDNILIGKYLGKSNLGYYEKSYSLMLLPIQNLTHVITPVLHPVLSNIQNQKNQIYENYKLISTLLAIIGFPISVLLYFSAQDIILLIYGFQWTKSIPVFKILSLSVGFQIVLSSSGSIFQAINRTALLFISGLISAVVIVSSILIGVFYFKNLVGIGKCLLLGFSVVFIQAFIVLIKFGLNESLLDFFKIFIPALISSVILFVALQYIPIQTNYLLVNILIRSIITLLFVVLSMIIPKNNRLIIQRLISKRKK